MQRVLAVCAGVMVPTALALCGAAWIPLSARVTAIPQAQVEDFVVTAAPVYVPLAEMRGEERFPRGAQLLRVHNGKTTPLVSGFAATADASVSFDGATVLFAGKRAAEDRWQIWEWTRRDGSVRRVMTTHSDDERPMYLPGGRMIWAERGAYGFSIVSGEDGHPPATPYLNPTAGPGQLGLTYVQTNAFPTDVLADGRILFESGFPLGRGSLPEMYVEYADGSGVESYRCDHGRARWGGAQVASGDVVFTHGRGLARFTSPLARETPLAAPAAEYAGAITETQSGGWLMSARFANARHYAIATWRPGETSLHAVVAVADEDLVEPVRMTSRVAPRRFPSALHPWTDGNLLGLESRLTQTGMLAGRPARVQVEMESKDGSAVALGSADVAADGSFYVKVPADRPIRFALVDGKGVTMRREHGWFWVRAGEQRACVGCHTGPERSADNAVPEILRKSTSPADLTQTSSAAAKAYATQGGSRR